MFVSDARNAYTYPMPAAPTHAHAQLPLPLPAAPAPAPARVLDSEHPFMQGAPPALAAPLRFQSPVTPQNHAESAAGRPRAASVAPLVKWDSDRKRRQGYFSAMDDGDEKSPFRHYTTGD